MAKDESKRSKISGVLQTLFAFKNRGTEMNEIAFTKGFILSCGSDYLETVSEDVAKKLYYGREMNKNIKDAFKGQTVDIKNATKFLSDYIDHNRVKELFAAFQILEELEKDLNLFFIAVAMQIENYRKYKEDSVSETIRNIYRRLLIERSNKDDYSTKETVFNSLAPTEQHLLKEYLAKQKKTHKRVISITNPNKTYKFYEVYVFNNITFEIEDEDGEGTGTYKTIESIDSTTLFNYCPNNLFIEASGGIGKTMLLKHLLLDSINRFDQTHIFPIFINVHEYKADEEFIHFLLRSINDILDYSIDPQTLDMLLKNGMCTILLDGLDELEGSLAVAFYKELEQFVRKNNRNRFVITSRPPASPNPIIDFKTLALMPLTKLQANQLIEKLEYNETIKDAFLKVLNSRLFKTHRLFCENPLLLTIMLMTFDKSGIPETKHLFYKKAYYTMAEKYDPTRGKYIRSLATKLTPDRLYDYIMEFAFRTYYDGAVTFSETDIDYYFNDLKEKKRYETEQCTSAEFIQDMEKHLCLFHKEGRKYRFIHRSFQEFFCAAYFNKQKDTAFSAIGDYLDHKQRINDTYIYFFESYLVDFFYDMAPNRFEEFIILPYLERFCKGDDNDSNFLSYLTCVYSGQIDYQDGDACDFGANMPQSQIFSFLADKYDLHELEILRLTPIEGFWAISYCKLYNFQREPCIYELTTKEEREESRNDETLCGDGYKIYIDIIQKNTDKYKELINELKNTYMYIHFTKLVGVYSQLKKKYKKKTTKDLVALLD